MRTLIPPKAQASRDSTVLWGTIGGSREAWV